MGQNKIIFNQAVEKAINSHNELVSEFKNESDRATVIIGAAKIDLLLQELLQARLLSTRGKGDKLFDGEAPLSSFSSKINLCFRMGLIKADFTQSLHMLRKIRNAFAHEVFGCSLDQEPYKNLVHEFLAPFSDLRIFNTLYNKLTGEPAPPNVLFRYILSLMVLLLEIVVDGTSRIETDRAISLDAISIEFDE